MGARIPWLRWTASLAWLLLVASGGAAREVGPAAGDDRVGPDERWVPGLSVFGSGMIQGRDGSVESAEAGFFLDDTLSVFADLGLSAELSTPALSWAPGRPRLFFHGDASLSFDTEEAVVNRGDPGPIEIQSALVGGIAPVAGVQGRGSATRVETQPLVLSAGLGLSFELPLGDRNLRIKPSLEWMWQRDQLRLLFGDAESEGPRRDLCSPCRTLFVEGTEKEGFHSLGPGLEIEVEAARVGDFMLTLYSLARVYHVLGPRHFELTEFGTWMTGGVPSVGREPSKVESNYWRERWHYRAGLGLRFLWLPE